MANLLYSKNLLHRVRAFMDFTRDLRTITNMTIELRRVLRDTHRVRRPRTSAASRALQNFILVKLDGTLRDSLHQFIRERGVNDGHIAFKHIRRLCAPQDTISKQDAAQRFTLIALSDTESIANFNKRFNSLRLLVEASGATMYEGEVLDQYLRSIRHVQKPTLLVDVKQYINHRLTETPYHSNLNLTDIQTTLQREEETSDRTNLPDIRTYTSQRPSASANNANQRRRFQPKPRPPARANNAKSAPTTRNIRPSTNRPPPITTRNPNIKCYGCGAIGHTLKTCPTTSATDKKKLYDNMRTRRAHSNNAQTTTHQSHASSVYRAHAATVYRAVYSANTVSQAMHARQTNKSTQVNHHTNYRFVVYEDEIIIDSGASDHMTGLPNVLCHQYDFTSSIQLPDGTMALGTTAGTMRVSCKCTSTGKTHVIPLCETLLVPGFIHTLWSVAAFAASGHEVVFGLTTVRVVLHKNMPEELIVHLNHPYYRHQQHQQIHANSASSTIRPKIKVPIELMHNRLGHPSFQSLIAAEQQGLYEDVTILIDHTDTCPDCLIGNIRVKNRTAKPVGPSTIPGEIWFADIVDNPSSVGLTRATYYPAYLNLIDSATKFQFYVGMPDKSSASVIDGFNTIANNFRPRNDFTMDDVAEIHVDAGTQLISAEVQQWASYRTSPIRIIAAAPKHQEQNGRAEAGWRHTRLIINKILTHAHLDYSYFDLALRHAWYIKNLLPLKKPTLPPPAEDPHQVVPVRSRVPRRFRRRTRTPAMSELIVPGTRTNQTTVMGSLATLRELELPPTPIIPGQQLSRSNNTNLLHPSLGDKGTSHHIIPPAIHPITDSREPVQATLPITRTVLSGQKISPFQNYFGRKPTIARLRVFGCPCYAKLYQAPNMGSAVTSKTLLKHNILQRAVRGIFVGFPINQAGFLIWMPNTRRFIISEDVSFDEKFDSSLAYPSRLFADANPSRDTRVSPILEGDIQGTVLFGHCAKTGLPLTNNDMTDHTTPWMNYQVYQPLVPYPEHFDIDTTNEHQHTDPLPVPPSAEEEHHHVTATHTMTTMTPQVSNDNAPLLTSLITDDDRPSSPLFDEDYPTDLEEETSPTQEADTYDALTPNVNIPVPSIVSPPTKFGTFPRSILKPSKYANPNSTDAARLNLNVRNAQPPKFPLLSEPTFKSQTSSHIDHPHTQLLPRKSNRQRKSTNHPDFVYPAPKRQYVKATHFSYANNAVKHSNVTDKESAHEFVTEFMENTALLPAGAPGSDPSYFLPEPRNLQQVLKLPPRYRLPWFDAWFKEVKGLFKRGTFVIGNPGPNDPVTPVMEIYKVKLDKYGNIEKLKLRVVFRGDLYVPTHPEDSWNPFATGLALKIFLATCSKYGIFPAQADFIQAYLQCDMKEKVYVKLPEFWKHHLPPDMAIYCGIPLEMKKALYGYTFSGKRLYEDQEEFFISQQLKQSSINGIWSRHLPNNGIIIVLLFADDILAASTDPIVLAQFRAKLSSRFDINWQPVADWYLQARITQDKDKNISLDQSRYSKAIVKRYLPNAPEEPTLNDLVTYHNPLPSNFKWTNADNSKDEDEKSQLEAEYGYRFIEAAGSLLYLANTAVRQLFAIRKMCKFTKMPGSKHFKAMHHLLNHIRCYPAKPLKYYHDVHQSPLALMLKHAGHADVDPTLVYSTDSSFADADEQRSTGCLIGCYQGGLMEMNSSVPTLISHSSAEAETVYSSITCLATFPTRRAIMGLLFDNEDRLCTVPLFTDSQAAIDIARNGKGTARTKHMSRRELYIRQCVYNGSILFLFIRGILYQLADIGTKGDISNDEFELKASVIEGSSDAFKLLYALLERRGVSESIPESLFVMDPGNPNTIRLKLGDKPAAASLANESKLLPGGSSGAGGSTSPIIEAQQDPDSYGEPREPGTNGVKSTHIRTP